MLYVYLFEVLTLPIMTRKPNVVDTSVNIIWHELSKWDSSWITANRACLVGVWYVNMVVMWLVYQKLTGLAWKVNNKQPRPI